MKATIIGIGDELILGQSIDTNSAWLAGHLTAMGFDITEHITLGDHLADLVDTLRRCCASSQVVIATGGLGPTEDDLTRFALAELLGCELKPDPEALRQIAAVFQRIGRPMTQANQVQGLIPAKASIIANRNGTAPGLQAQWQDCRLYFMPGVPAEMKEMFEHAIQPDLTDWMNRQGRPDMLVTRLLHTCGEGESNIGAALKDLMRRGANPTVNTTAKEGVVTVRINARANSEEAARQLIQPIEADILQRIGTYVFGFDQQTMQEVVIDTMRSRNLTLTVAESCTGGFLGQTLTQAPGSSDVFHGGWICYSNTLKMNLLGVNPDDLDQHGAVSEPVVLQLAANARLKSGADLALAISGIAGPGGGSEDKPVGTVWIGLASPQETQAYCFHFIGDRERIRIRSVNMALQLLYQYLNRKPVN